MHSSPDEAGDLTEMMLKMLKAMEALPVSGTGTAGPAGSGHGLGEGLVQGSAMRADNSFAVTLKAQGFSAGPGLVFGGHEAKSAPNTAMPLQTGTQTLALPVKAGTVAPFAMTTEAATSISATPHPGATNAAEIHGARSNVAVPMVAPRHAADPVSAIAAWDVKVPKDAAVQLKGQPTVSGVPLQGAAKADSKRAGSTESQAVKTQPAPASPALRLAPEALPVSAVQTDGAVAAAARVGGNPVEAAAKKAALKQVKKDDALGAKGSVAGSVAVVPAAVATYGTSPAPQTARGAKQAVEPGTASGVAVSATLQAVGGVQPQKPAAARAETHTAVETDPANSAANGVVNPDPSKPSAPDIGRGPVQNLKSGATVGESTSSRLAAMGAGVSGAGLSAGSLASMAQPTATSSAMPGNASTSPANSAGGSYGVAGAGAAKVAELPPSYDHRMLMTSPKMLEVGVAEGTAGWLKIRAELGAGGAVSASLMAATSAGTAMLHRELPGLNAFLTSERSPVQASVLSQPGGGSGAGSRGQAEPQGRGGQQRRASASGGGFAGTGRTQPVEMQEWSPFPSGMLPGTAFSGGASLSVRA